jgi:hypothetical protein
VHSVLHPGLKLEYFRSQEWEEEWIDLAENLTREEYIERYENLDVPEEEPEEEAMVRPVICRVNIFYYNLLQESDDPLGEFGNVSVTKKAFRRNELEEYLALPVENVRDPLKWWYENRRAYPILSRMGLDYLSIPGMFVYSFYIYIADF